jgi:hypothetical protein
MRRVVSLGLAAALAMSIGIGCVLFDVAEDTAAVGVEAAADTTAVGAGTAAGAAEVGTDAAVDATAIGVGTAAGAAGAVVGEDPEEE